MRKNLAFLVSTGLAATLGLMTVPAVAQDDAPETTTESAVPLTPEQQAEVEGWPPDRQVAYQAWPDATKNYYWSLVPKRQMLFWRLTDEDKVALSAMSSEEQESIWKNLEMRGQEPSAPSAPPPPADEPPMMM